MRDVGPGDMGSWRKTEGRKVDLKAMAQEIAGIDDPVERRQALDRTPSLYRAKINALVFEAFRGRMNGI